MTKFKTVPCDFEEGLSVPVIPGLTRLILAQVEASPHRFEMSNWHSAYDENGIIRAEPVCGCAECKVAYAKRPPPALELDRIIEAGTHHCGTAHCIAGWAIHLAGEHGALLERHLGPNDAALELFRAAGERAPAFIGSNEKALKELRELAAMTPPLDPK